MSLHTLCTCKLSIYYVNFGMKELTEVNNAMQYPAYKLFPSYRHCLPTHPYATPLHYLGPGRSSAPPMVIMALTIT
nr:MAG TPA: hypothetical protein [Caudoviricetes sp.]